MYPVALLYPNTQSIFRLFLSLTTNQLTSTLTPTLTPSLAQLNAYPQVGDYPIAYDDIFKFVIWTPFSLLMISWIDSLAIPSPTYFQRSVLNLLSGMYVYGFGVNHSCNAISNYGERLGGGKGVGGKMEGWVYFYDEYVGHWIIVAVYAALQVWWVLNTDGGGEGGKKGGKGGGGGIWLFFIGAFGGYFSSMLIIESQAVPLIIPLDLLIFLLASRVSRSTQLSKYITINSAGHFIMFAVWHWMFGRWVEPSELRGEGWKDLEVMSLGLLRN